MIDFHTHILPNIDDGAVDVEAAAKMFEKEKENGVSTVVLTSHYYAKRRSPEAFLAKRAECFERVKPYIPEGIEVRLAAEVHFKGHTGASFDGVCKLAIEGTRYVLIELPFMNKWSGRLWQKLLDFIRETDYIPVLAHVERYSEIKRNPKILAFLLEIGCLFQVNTSAFLEKETASLAFAMLKKGYVHCLGTDSHNLDDRACDYAEAKRVIEGKGFGEAFERAQQIMGDILANERLTFGKLPTIKKFFRRYF